jgi:glycosyltransferase involved in cell wall biosynthesis
MTPVVTVIIPTHNRSALVGDAIDSVLSQKGLRFEVIVVDDGSTDETTARLEGYGDRIRCVRQPHRGVSAARNHGVRLARGSWLAFLDSDDQWLPGKLVAQLTLHTAERRFGLSQTAERWVRNGRHVNQCAHHQPPTGEFFMASLLRCVVSPSAAMVRRDLFEAVGGFDESLAVCEDYDLWLRLAARTELGFIPRALVVKRAGHEEQLSERYWGMDRFRVAALVRVLAEQELNPVQRHAVLDVLRRKCTTLAHGARRRRRDAESVRYQILAEVCARV